MKVGEPQTRRQFITRSTDLLLALRSILEQVQIITPRNRNCLFLEGDEQTLVQSAELQEVDCCSSGCSLSIWIKVTYY